MDFLGKSPISKSLQSIQKSMSSVSKTADELIKLEKSSLTEEKKRLKKEEERDRKEDAKKKRFGLDIKKTIKKMAKESEKQTKNIIDTIKDLLIKGLIGIIAGALAFVGTKIVENWDKVVALIETLKPWVEKLGQMWDWFAKNILPTIGSVTTSVASALVDTYGPGGRLEQEKQLIDAGIIPPTGFGGNLPSTGVGLEHLKSGYGVGYVQYLNTVSAQITDKFKGKKPNKVEYSEDGKRAIVTFSDGSTIEYTSPSDVALIKTWDMSRKSWEYANAPIGAMGENPLIRYAKVQKQIIDMDVDGGYSQEEYQKKVKEADEARKKLQESLPMSGDPTGGGSSDQGALWASEAFRRSSIADQKANGGPISGRIKTGDTVPAMLEHGEYVLNRNAVDAIGKDNLDDINFNRVPRFKNGGNVSSLSSVLKLQSGGSAGEPMESAQSTLTRTQAQNRNNQTTSASGSGGIIGYTGGLPGAPGSGRSTGPHVHLEQGTGRKDGINYDASEAGKYIKVDGKPINSFPMTSDYGPRGTGHHYGKDFGIPAGLPITLANGAKFMGFDKTSNLGGYGYFADIMAGGKHWLAAHLSREGNAAPGSTTGSEPVAGPGASTGPGGPSSDPGKFDPMAGLMAMADTAGNIGKFIKGFYEGFTSTFGKSPASSGGNVTSPTTSVTSSSPSYSGGMTGTINGMTGDKVHTILENGEFVLNRNAVKLLGKENLEDINFNLAPRFGDRSMTSGLMRHVNEGSLFSSVQSPQVVVSGVGSQGNTPVPTAPPAPSDTMFPSLPSMPPSHIMNSLAFRPSGTSYSLYR